MSGIPSPINWLIWLIVVIAVVIIVIILVKELAAAIAILQPLLLEQQPTNILDYNYIGRT